MQVLCQSLNAMKCTERIFLKGTDIFIEALETELK